MTLNTPGALCNCIITCHRVTSATSAQLVIQYDSILQSNVVNEFYTTPTMIPQIVQYAIKSRKVTPGNIIINILVIKDEQASFRLKYKKDGGILNLS